MVACCAGVGGGGELRQVCRAVCWPRPAVCEADVHLKTGMLWCHLKYACTLYHSARGASWGVCCSQRPGAPCRAASERNPPCSTAAATQVGMLRAGLLVRGFSPSRGQAAAWVPGGGVGWVERQGAGGGAPALLPTLHSTPRV